ncbi:LPXTG cell wall anchor domain-containing protein [Secundilactobacillus similis]|nr:LPXTG cell wall anchor domain-containing protein [Secundilactobacillus similis]
MPQTNEQTPSAWAALGLGILGALGALGVGRRKHDED